MLAVIKTGGKQYLVTPEQTLKVEKLDAQADGRVMFDNVLLVEDNGNVVIGTPRVAGASVEAQVLRQGRARKVIVFKYHNKTRYRKKKGHRQSFTEVKIEKIVTT